MNKHEFKSALNETITLTRAPEGLFIVGEEEGRRVPLRFGPETILGVEALRLAEENNRLRVEFIDRALASLSRISQVLGTEQEWAALRRENADLKDQLDRLKATVSEHVAWREGE